MATTSKVLAYVLGIIAVAVAVAMLLYLVMPRTSFGASPAGSSFSDAKIADVSVNFAAPGANATSTSVLNTDANDRYISYEKVGCEGVGTSQTAYTGTGLASLTVTIATSSTAAPSGNANTNTLPVITVGTSTSNFVMSSSTAAAPGSNLVSNIWAANSYLTFTTNATNTAKCIVGVNYSGS